MLSSKDYIPSSRSIDIFLEELCVPKKYLDDVEYYSVRDQEFSKLMDAPILADWEPIPERLSENVYLFVPEWTASSSGQWDWWQNRLLFCPPLTLRIGENHPPQTYLGYALNSKGELERSDLYVRNHMHAAEVLELLRFAHKV